MVMPFFLKCFLAISTISLSSCGKILWEISINDVLTHYGIASIPFGGEGLSGIGRMHGKEGLRSLSRTKSIVINRFNFINEIWWIGRSKKIENLLNKAIDILFK